MQLETGVMALGTEGQGALTSYRLSTSGTSVTKRRSVDGSKRRTIKVVGVLLSRGC